MQAERRLDHPLQLAVITFEAVVAVPNLAMLELGRERALLLQLRRGLITRGIQSRLRFRAAERKRLAVLALRRATRHARAEEMLRAD